MKNLFSVIVDSLFCAFTSFILLKFIFSLFLSNALSIVLAIFIACFLLILYFSLFNKKRNFNKLALGERKKAELTLTQLAFMTDFEVSSLFYSALTEIGYKAVRRGNKLVIPEKDCVIFFAFSPDGITKSQIIKCYNFLDNRQKAVIFSREFSSEIKDYCKYFDNKIILVDGEKIYALLKKANSFPKNKILFFSQKKKTFDFSLLLRKKRAKNYFFFGIVFLLYSFLVPIKLYYIIFGSLSLFFALLCALFGKSTPKKEF